MRRAAEWDLADLRRRASALDADRAALLAALSEPAHGLLALEAASRRLRVLAAEATELDAGIEAGVRASREHGLAQKRSEAGIARLADAQRRTGERRAMLDTLDDLAARPGAEPPDASLPKATPPRVRG